MNHTMARVPKKGFFTFSRLIFLICIGLVCVVGLWLFLRSAIVKGTAETIQNMESKGYQITHGGLSVTGFPFNAIANSSDISVHAPRGTLGDMTKNWAIKLDQITAKSATFTPLSWMVKHRGTARVDMRNLTGQHYVFNIDPANININTRQKLGGALKSAHFDMDVARIKPLLNTVPSVVGLEHAQADLAVNGHDAQITMNARDLDIVDQTLGPLGVVLGPKLEHIELNARVQNWAMFEQYGAQYWQQNGGRFRAQYWHIKWGQIDIAGDFDIGFKDGSPDGIFHANVKNIGPLVDSLGRAGILGPVETAQARLLLGVLQPDAEGRTELELIIRDHKIKMGPITLMQF